MNGKWVVIALLTAVALFGLSGLQKHKWKVRLALLGVAMGLTPLHKDLINAIATSVIFGVIFLVVGSAIDFFVWKFFHKEKKSEMVEEPKTQATDESEIKEISGFDLERVKRLSKANSSKTAE